MGAYGWTEERVRELVETVAGSFVVHEKEDEIIKGLIGACDYFLDRYIKNLHCKRDIDSVISMLAHILYEVAKLKALREGGGENVRERNTRHLVADRYNV